MVSWIAWWKRYTNVRSALLLSMLFMPIMALAVFPQQSPVPGGIVVMAIAPETSPAPLVKFQKKRVMLVRSDGMWHAVVGLPLSVVVGEQQLSIVDGDTMRTLTFQVQPKQYEAQYITLANKRQVNPTPDDLKRISHEQSLSRLAFNTWSETMADDLRFDLPALGRLSSSFGLRRFFNKQPRQPHSGLDIAAPEGTPVLAPAAGTIIDIGHYFFNGNTIFIDHGQGLVSMYNHLSRISIQKGQRVARGQQIGAIGKTGRVTGAHLHWSVSLNDARVDPMLFLSPSALKSATPLIPITPAAPVGKVTNGD